MNRNPETPVFSPGEFQPRRQSNRIIFSLTSIFFVFGVLLAFGVRSIEAVRQKEKDEKITLDLKQKQMETMQRELAREEKDRIALQEQIEKYQEQVENYGRASKTQTEMKSNLRKV